MASAFDPTQKLAQAWPPVHERFLRINSALVLSIFRAFPIQLQKLEADMTRDEAALEIGSALELLTRLSSRLCEVARYIEKGEAIPQQLQIEYAEIAEVDRQSELALKGCKPLLGDSLIGDWIPVKPQQLPLTTAKGLCTHFQEKKVILERALAKLELAVVRMPFGSTTAPGVFLSHNWNDKWFVRKLAAELQSYDVCVWLDEAEIKIGESLIEKVHDAIGRAKYVIAVISKNSVKSQWVKQELQVAMSMQITRGEIRRQRLRYRTLLHG